jgi:hypothetical protein
MEGTATETSAPAPPPNPTVTIPSTQPDATNYLGTRASHRASPGEPTIALRQLPFRQPVLNWQVAPTYAERIGFAL